MANLLYNLAQPFSDTKQYTQGAIVIYNDRMYEMTADEYTPGPFDPEKFTERFLSEMISGKLNSNLEKNIYCVDKFYSGGIKANKTVSKTITIPDDKPTYTLLIETLFDAREMSSLSYEGDGIISVNEFCNNHTYLSYWKMNLYMLTVKRGSTVTLTVTVNGTQGSYQGAYAYTITPIDLSGENFVQSTGNYIRTGSGASEVSFSFNKYCILFGNIDKRTGLNVSIDGAYTSFGGYFLAYPSDYALDSGIPWYSYGLPQIVILKAHGDTTIVLQNTTDAPCAYSALCV